jgi:hypothetical protein
VASVAREVEIIRCNFIGDFKVGDNIVANARALCRMSAQNKFKTFNKLMVVQAGSILEAALHQILYRAQQHTKEGVPNIPADELRQIQAKEIGRFNNIIQTMKKHKLLDGLGEAIYTDHITSVSFATACISNLITNQKEGVATNSTRSLMKR